ncbi:hypothetical protein T01_14066 [Trichinella spiralis]|uniref:Uncharacterized protein n=1 Tax=Trichinella spiralis TaxID=6334 RepID=A0A0V1BR03_TRISP|nr:hypothetical protein T01_14066 [Trichinella spiralis]
MFVDGNFILYNRAKVLFSSSIWTCKINLFQLQASQPIHAAAQLVVCSTQLNNDRSCGEKSWPIKLPPNYAKGMQQRHSQRIISSFDLSILVFFLS